MLENLKYKVCSTQFVELMKTEIGSVMYEENLFMELKASEFFRRYEWIIWKVLWSTASIRWITSVQLSTEDSNMILVYTLSLY